jgi:hypothetical protein
MGIGMAAFYFFISVSGEANWRQVQAQHNIAGWLCAATCVLAFIWLIAVAIIHSYAIRPTEITDFEIRLAKVSPRFRDAVAPGGPRSAMGLRPIDQILDPRPYFADHRDHPNYRPEE